MKVQNRTEQQVKSYFLYLEWIAQELNNQNIPLAKLVEKVQPRATKNTLHELFKHILEKMYGKTSTKNMSREELSETLDVLQIALSELGLVLPFPEADKNNLLQHYN